MSLNLNVPAARAKCIKQISYLVLLSVFIFSGCQKTDLSKETKKTGNSITSISSGLSEDARTTGPPNIVLFIADDFGYEIPTINGGQSYTTPNIDQLANSGMSFSQFYGSALCSPARVMLLTGKYNFRNYTEWGVLQRSNVTLGNMFKNGGYATCYTGKWQLDGGDVSIRGFGFDNYSVWLENKVVPEEANGSRYKSSPILQDGQMLSNTTGKYSVDIFTKYAANFMRNNQDQPFLLYYAITLPHKQFTPTPDDPEFTTWDYTKGNKRFFPNMVKYLDKQVKILRDSIAGLGLTNNTVFIFVGDNGTPDPIVSTFKGKSVAGTKGTTTTYGTHVPLIVSWPGNISAGVYRSQLADFTDFVPTLSDITGVSIPASMGIIDGKSFYPVLNGSNTSSRDYIFNHYQPLISPNSRRTTRYTQDSVYKLYEDGGFYNMVKDVLEKSPISNGALTPAESAKKQYFQQILNQMHN